MCSNCHVCRKLEIMNYVSIEVMMGDSVIKFVNPATCCKAASLNGEQHPFFGIYLIFWFYFAVTEIQRIRDGAVRMAPLLLVS